jgi:hypothetical protein
MMNVIDDKVEADMPKHKNESPLVTGGRTLASHVRAVLADFPSNLDNQIKLKPYATLAAVGAIGMGTGILLGSRILRLALASAASYAAVELAHSLLRPSAQVRRTGPEPVQQPA